MKKKYFSLSNSFLEGNQKENWNAIKNDYDGLSLSCSAKTELIEDNRFRVVMSTPKENRNGYEIMQTFDFKAYKLNPVLIDNHRTESIADIIGRVENIRKNKDGNHEGDTIFALNSPKGELAYKLTKDGFLNAVSITIMPLEFDDDGRITKSEVLELSYVIVPADRKTLVKRNKKEDESIKNCKHCEEHGSQCMDCNAEITNDKEHFERMIGENVVELICESCYKKDQEKENKVESKVENKESRKEQILRILENKKKKDIEIVKEVLAVATKMQNRLINNSKVDKDKELVKKANRLKKLTKKL